MAKSSRSRSRRNPDPPKRSALAPLTRETRSVTAPARSTMRVSLASRVLADTLPDVIYSKEKPRSVPSLATPSPPARGVRPAAKPAPARSEPVRPNVQKQKTDRANPAPDRSTSNLQSAKLCRTPPKSNAGNGTSRAFVPWSKGSCK